MFEPFPTSTSELITCCLSVCIHICAAGIAWFPLWMFYTHETPEAHPGVSKEELLFIRTDIAESCELKHDSDSAPDQSIEGQLQRSLLSGPNSYSPLPQSSIDVVEGQISIRKSSTSSSVNEEPERALSAVAFQSEEAPLKHVKVLFITIISCPSRDVIAYVVYNLYPIFRYY